MGVLQSSPWLWTADCREGELQVGRQVWMGKHEGPKDGGGREIGKKEAIFKEAIANRVLHGTVQ